MLDFLPFPKIDGDSVEKKFAQINNFLIQFKEAIEFALGSMSDENKTMSESLAKSLNASNETREDELTQVSSHISKDNDRVTSLIEQTAEEITSTVSQSQTKWVIDEESLWVDIYGYGIPRNDNAETNKGKHYLDMETGMVYGTITDGEGRVVWTSLGECEKAMDKVYSEIAQNAYEITLKVSKGDVCSEISLDDAGDISIKGNRIMIESDKFKLTKDGNIEMLSGKIKIQGSVIKYAGDYTQADADRANRITIGTVEPTIEDFEKLDLNGDGVINVLDASMIQRLVNGMDLQREIPTSIEINPLNAHGVLKTEGVFVGANGIYSKSVNMEKTYMKNVYVMNEGGGFTKGANGSYTTADGKTVSVINGIITSII